MPSLSASLASSFAHLPESAESMLRGSSGLFFAGYTVSMEAGLLMRLHVQVVEHQFELIERAISLSLGYCISSNGGPGAGPSGGQEGRSLSTTVELFTVNNTNGSRVVRATASTRQHEKTEIASLGKTQQHLFHNTSS